ncbi:hypothetical protein A2215_04030 [Candidatus Berkelbacteria bacterium RIFOXYA2_FULL_43_10]|uniref:phosphoglycerate mutase (2,3-diphosphoglycerate-independent) n=1 Tax=Candidatus Berkelbacteria bacterium RIFOXYA2_FULL_43_10 TaxID=1797472 RepID=A0A1F5EEX3_9BACT|nr:MAG: hypothetical protein A2215_04030 [Candidatus Berkelbacteria bacterium RIFOXYA2_FULL_43_10]
MIKKLSLIILNGWGLSSSWGGNAIAAANPGNFLKFWGQGLCMIIKPAQKKAGLYADEDGITLSEIYVGREVKRIKEIVDDVVGRRELGECLELKKSIENCKTNTSSLNLVTTIAENDEYSDPDNIKILLEILKVERIRNINIHLILEGETGAVSRKVETLANSINDFEEAQISSIQGNHYLSEIGSKNFQRSYSSIVLGTGEKALDAISVLSKNKNLPKLDDLEPHIICSGNQAIGKIFDFDSVLSLDYKRSNLNNFIRYLSAFEVGSKSYKPMGIKISTLTDYYYGAGPKDIGIIIDRDQINNSVLSLAEDAGLKNVEIFGSKNSWKHYYLSGFKKKNQSSGSCIVVANDGSEKTYDAKRWLNTYRDTVGDNINIITSYLSASDFSARTGSIKEDIESIKVVDKLLGEMVEINFQNNYQTIILADESGLESAGINSNPLPFIYLKDSESLNNDDSLIQRKITIEGLLRAKSSTYDIAPTICKIMDITKPDEMTGESLI